MDTICLVACIYLMFMYITNGITEIVYIFFTTSGSVIFSPAVTFEAAIKNGKERFSVPVNNVNITQSYSLSDYAFGASELAMMIGQVCVNLFVSTLSYGPLPLTFWMAAKGFEEHILEILNSAGKDCNVLTVHERIIECYSSLKHLTCSMNSLWASIVLVHVMQRSLDMIEFHRKFSAVNMATCRMGLTQIFLVIAVILMSEGRRVMSRFKEWVNDPWVRIKFFNDKYELGPVVRDLDVNAIGIGLTGLYRVNYGFVAQVLCRYVIWTLILIHQATTMISNLNEFIFGRKSSATNYFYLVMDMLTFIRQLVFYWIVHTKEKSISGLLTSMSSAPLTFLQRPSKTPNWNNVKD
ncbi:unnamed protein product [Orchesella dallaii]|uniref:Gustatory receptor n=1 Tax=Orchesella dallaii TaxID=48710 RepID=A0ABP1RLK5_9HEXA